MIDGVRIRMKTTEQKRPTITPQQAAAVLEHIFEQCGVEPNTVPMEALSAYTVYRSERFHLQKGILAAVLVMFFLLPFLFVRARFTADMQEDGLRKLPVYTVRVENVLPVHSVKARQKNRMLPVYEADAKTFTIEPTRNGTLRISVELFNRQETTMTTDVQGVDRKGPDFLGSEVLDGRVFLYVGDEGIGVDYDGVYAANGAGIRIQPAETDPDTGTVVFPYPEEAWDVYIPDHIGNTLHLALKFE